MPRLAAFALLAAALHAQDAVKPAEKPPAKVDQALRARANQYYEDFVKGQFGDAETLVSQDSRNYFISIRKETYLSCEIKGITYSDKFKSAVVSAMCERNVMFQGFAGRPLKYPIPSTWRFEHGKWFWWADPTPTAVTPFGMMLGLSAASTAAIPAAQPDQPAKTITLPSPAELSSPEVALHKVHADRDSLTLKVGESAGVTFSNSAFGPMSVSLNGAPPEGMEVTPTHADLQQNGQATVTVKALDGAKTKVLSFEVFPTGETIAVKVVIQ